MKMKYLINDGICRNRRKPMKTQSNGGKSMKMKENRRNDI